MRRAEWTLDSQVSDRVGRTVGLRIKACPRFTRAAAADRQNTVSTPPGLRPHATREGDRT